MTKRQTAKPIHLTRRGEGEKINCQSGAKKERFWQNCKGEGKLTNRANETSVSLGGKERWNLAELSGSPRGTLGRVRYGF